MDARARAVAEVSRHCDLTERLSLLPPSVSTRGMFFSSIDATLADAGKLEAYRALFPQRMAALRWHPTAEFLTRLAVGGGMLYGPERVHDGMSEIGRRNAAAFMDSILGRTLLRLLSRDPRKVLQQGIVGHRQGVSHAVWTLEFPSERSAIMTMRQEYAYIESYYVGAAHGTFEAIDLAVHVEVELGDRFNGKHILTW
jgi:uncharacterized protein (TIGR02265 family)